MTNRQQTQGGDVMGNCILCGDALSVSGSRSIYEPGFVSDWPPSLDRFCRSHKALVITALRKMCCNPVRPMDWLRDPTDDDIERFIAATIRRTARRIEKGEMVGFCDCLTSHYERCKNRARNHYNGHVVCNSHLKRLKAGQPMNYGDGGESPIVEMAKKLTGSV